jgi:hypothetical protein
MEADEASRNDCASDMIEQMAMVGESTQQNMNE